MKIGSCFSMFTGAMFTGLFWGTPVVLASDLPISKAGFCTLHYSQVAYGKDVQSVMAHTGFQTCTPERQYYWVGVQDVTLDKAATGDQFTGKVILKGNSSASRCQLTPVVQFWVTFADGTTKIEDVVEMKTVEQFRADETNPAGTNLQARKAVDHFLSRDQIGTVECINVWSNSDAALQFSDLVTRTEPTAAP